MFAISRNCTDCTASFARSQANQAHCCAKGNSIASSGQRLGRPVRAQYLCCSPLVNAWENGPMSSLPLLARVRACVCVCVCVMCWVTFAHFCCLRQHPPCILSKCLGAARAWTQARVLCDVSLPGCACCDEWQVTLSLLSLDPEL